MNPPTEELLPAGLLQKKSQDGSQTTMEATLMAQQTPAQREQASHHAVAAAGPAHPESSTTALCRVTPSYLSISWSATCL